LEKKPCILILSQITSSTHREPEALVPTIALQGPCEKVDRDDACKMLAREHDAVQFTLRRTPSSSTHEHGAPTVDLFVAYVEQACAATLGFAPSPPPRGRA
jgi:hypothetical protein